MVSMILKLLQGFRWCLKCFILGNHGSFSIEVQVGSGDDSYKTLINPSTFMSVSDSRLAKNLNAVKMFKQSKCFTTSS